MPWEYCCLCPLPNGLHGRPASHLETFVSRFQSKVLLINERSGVKANARSVLSLIGADIKQGDPLRFLVGGSDQEVLGEALSRFILKDWVQAEGVLPEPPTQAVDRRIPRSLQAILPKKVLYGFTACRGLAEGSVVRLGGLAVPDLTGLPFGSVAEELEKFQAAVRLVQEALESERSLALGFEAQVLKTHLSLVKDSSLVESVQEHLQAFGGGVGAAIMQAIEKFSQNLRQSTSRYLQERVLDLEDVGCRLLTVIYGPTPQALVPHLRERSIVVAKSLSPRQFLALDRTQLCGLILNHAGATSHTVILARSAGLPTLTGVDGALSLADGEKLILDANLGLVFPVINEPLRRYYSLEKTKLARIRATEETFRYPSAVSRDGQRLPIFVNLTSSAEVSSAMALGAEGVGLFRTEMLFMDRDQPPSEEEQTAIYRQAAQDAQGRPVLIRTFDIGGDKRVGYLRLSREINPCLGYRGARLYEEFAALLKTQIRAIFKASEHGPLKIMAPMIACVEEFAAFLRVVQEVQADFPNSQVPVGVMIEIPSAVYALPDLAELADFFSLGTNDLSQYFLATDRDNPKVSGLYSPFHPSFLRLLRQAVQEAHASRRPIGLCGEMAENMEALPILLGLGLDSVSLAACRAASMKQQLAKLESGSCRELLSELCSFGTREKVQQQLQEFRQRSSPLPLLSLGLIQDQSEATTKHEVIKELTDLLAAEGRLLDAVAFEEAVWFREESSSTGFGFGFAVPHCQSSQLLVNSLSLVRLREPVAWDSVDGELVNVAILLAICETDRGREHLRIFSLLSRLIMREEFRQRVEQAKDSREIHAVLVAELSDSAHFN